MGHDSTPINLLDTPPSISAARIAILALRTGVPPTTALARDRITLVPDSAVLPAARAAELLTAISPPVRCGRPEVRNGVLVVQCDQLSEPRARDQHELTYVMSRRTRLGRGQDLSDHALAKVRVLLDGRDEQLLVTGEAFDRWVATYSVPHSMGGGPVHDGQVDGLELGDAVRANRPDHAFGFFPPSKSSTTITLLSGVEDLEAADRLDASTLTCTRCGKRATKILRTITDDRDTPKPLCADCAAKAFPEPPARPNWPDDPAAITPELLPRLLSALTPEQMAHDRASIVESINRWFAWADGIFPAGVPASPDIVAIRALIKHFREVLGLG